MRNLDAIPNAGKRKAVRNENDPHLIPNLVGTPCRHIEQELHRDLEKEFVPFGPRHFSRAPKVLVFAKPSNLTWMEFHTPTQRTMPLETITCLFCLLPEHTLRRMRTIFVATERTLIDTVTFTGVSAYVENCTARYRKEKSNYRSISEWSNRYTGETSHTNRMSNRTDSILSYKKEEKRWHASLLLFLTVGVSLSILPQRVRD